MCWNQFIWASYRTDFQERPFHSAKLIADQHMTMLVGSAKMPMYTAYVMVPSVHVELYENMADNDVIRFGSMLCTLLATERAHRVVDGNLLLINDDFDGNRCIRYRIDLCASRHRGSGPYRNWQRDRQPRCRKIRFWL